jgi:hypothetical protein
MPFATWRYIRHKSVCGSWNAYNNEVWSALPNSNGSFYESIIARHMRYVIVSISLLFNFYQATTIFTSFALNAWL